MIVSVGLTPIQLSFGQPAAAAETVGSAVNFAPAVNVTFPFLISPAGTTVGTLSASDPDAGDTITYAWDLDGDGAYDDSTAAAPSFTYTTPGVVTEAEIWRGLTCFALRRASSARLTKI